MPKPTKDEIRVCVIDSLKEFIPDDKRNLNLVGETNPIRDLGLTSDDGVDYACSLSDKLNYYIPDNINPFVDDAGNRPRTIAGMVDLLCKLIRIEEESDVRD